MKIGSLLTNQLYLSKQPCNRFSSSSLQINNAAEQDSFTCNKISFNGEKLNIDELTKLGITLSGKDSATLRAKNNVIDCYKYVEENSDRLPNIEDYKKINKILNKDIPMHLKVDVDLSGIIQCGEEDAEKVKQYLLNRINNTEKIEKSFQWLERNHGKQDTFRVAGKMLRDTLGCSPFFDANGRTCRALLDWILLHDGYKMTNHPRKLSLSRTLPLDEVIQIIKNNSEKI